MRILFLTHRLPYAPNRGDRIRAFHLLRLLARDHEVQMVSLIHDRDEHSHLADVRRVCAVEGVRVPRLRNALAAVLALPGKRPLTHVLLHSPAMESRLQRCVQNMRPQIVLAYCTGMARYAFEAPLNRFPVVLDMVDVDSEKWKALAAQSRGPRAFVYGREAARLREFERNAVMTARVTAVCSERERQVLAEVAPADRAIVAPNGVDTEYFAPPTAASQDPRVVFCGVFNYEPNIVAAIWFVTEIWPLVKRAHPRARLSLVGANPTSAVRALASDTSIDVTGSVPDVRPYLWQAAVAVAPLKIARGVQNKVLEALAAGLPCVTSTAVLGGLPARVRRGCTAADTPEEFAAAVASLLDRTPAERRDIADAATVGELSWAHQLRPLIDAISAVA